VERAVARRIRGDGASAEAVVEILETLLADQYVLYTKTRNYHWNVTGPLFGVLHKFFEEQYEKLNDMIDDVAERIRTLEHRAPGTLREFLETSTIQEQGEDWPDARGMISRLLADHESIITELRQNVDIVMQEHADQSTADFMIEILRVHEKMAWMLRAQLSA
jgi:starvation-inducible DNA-binding protein